MNLHRRIELRFAIPNDLARSGMTGNVSLVPNLRLALNLSGKCFLFLLGLMLAAVTARAASVPVSAAYTWTTLAGFSVSGSADGVGTQARFDNPAGIATDTNGNTYVVDAGNYTIRRISAAGEVSTIAGYAGVRGFTDDSNGKALFNSPTGITVDRSGNVLVADELTICPSCDGFNHYVVRKLSPVGTNWFVTTIVDSAVDNVHIPIDHGDRVLYSGGLAADGEGNIYLAEGQAIRMISPVGTNWTVSTVANTGGHTWFDGDRDFSGQRPSVTNYFIPKYPGGQWIAIDTNRTLYCASGSAISKLTPVGTNWGPSSLDVAHLADLPSLANKLKQPGRPIDTWLASQLSFATAAALANYSGGYGETGDPKALQAALLPDLNALIQGPPIYDSQRFDGVVLRSETRTLLSSNTQEGDVAHLNRVLLEDAYPLELARNPGWVTATVAGLFGSPGSVDGLGSDARFQNSTGIAMDRLGNLYVADGGRTIRALSPQGTNWLVSTLAGSPGRSGSSDGSGTNALFNGLFGVAVDRQENLIVTDSGNNMVRKVTAAGAVRAIAGSVADTQIERAGSVDGVGREARFNRPNAVTVDGFGNVYVADSGNGTIRMVTPAGSVSTVAGPGSGSADGVGIDAGFGGMLGIAVDSAGNLYVADGAVRRITPAGVVSTIPGVSADDVNVDKEDNVLILSHSTDFTSHIIQKIMLSETNWVVSTIATVPRFDAIAFAAVSDERLYFVTDFGQVVQLILDGSNWVTNTIANVGGHPQDIAVDGAGNLYLGHVHDNTSEGDFGHTVQMITPQGTNWLVRTIGGPTDRRLDTQGGNVDGTGSEARFQLPYGIAVDTAGNVYVGDVGNNNIRKGVFTGYSSANPVPYTPPSPIGQLTVTLVPPEAGGQWRFPWELGWHDSGITVSNLGAGNYPVEFRNAPGWLTISLSDPVPMTNGETVSITRECYPTLTGEDANTTTGSLTVLFGPTSPPGAGWRFLGETTPYFTNVFTTNLPPATYLIEFAFVIGRVKPPSQAVQVKPGAPAFLSVNYPIAPTRPAGVYLPFRVPDNVLNDETTYPFGFNGQLLSDTGYGSGVAVDTHVVLTAAHLVFNDATLSYVSDVHWFFRRDAGVSEPLPQAARSFFVLSGYAERRTNDYPVASTPQSRNFDVAALYFPDPVAGGGHGGYLPSDAVPNTWLTSRALKMLVGYPVDGSQFGDASIVPGKMYQTDPQLYTLSAAVDSVEGRQEVYVAPWFLSYPGNSGGPLYVQLNGSYYPAGVYLGTLFNGNTPYASAVRAIDSTVVNLITNAAMLGESGTNNTGGGVITLVPSQAISAKHPGYLSFRLGPPAAVTAGAGWRLQGDMNYSSATNYTRAINSTNAITIEFKPIPGWILPTNVMVSIVPGIRRIVDANYAPETRQPRLSVLSTNGDIELRLMEGIDGQAYQIEKRSSLTEGAWETVSIMSNSFNLVLPKPGANEPTMFYRARSLP
jgi:sugar lactone lactonase YvrE